MRLLLLAGLLSAVCAPVAAAAQWYVGPGGSPKGKGTREAPWDIVSTLEGRKEVRPGDTVFLLAGTYRRRPAEQFSVRLVGTKARPIHVRPAPGQRARIDGGLAVLSPSAHVWIWDLELFVSEPQPAKPVGPGPHPSGFTRPWGGLHASGGSHCKFIHLVIHDCRQGVSWWSGSRDSELYGCLIHDNGWPATDRGHGHAVYTQNRDGTKVIADCIMTGGHGYSMHAYGSKRADVDNYRIEGNIVYRADLFLVGGGKPSKHIRVQKNILHGVSMQIGYSAPYNEDCEVRDNWIVDGTLTISRYKKAVKEGNTVLPRGSKRPGGSQVFLRPSKYDPKRAHLAVFNWDKKPTVAVPLEGFLKPGDSYRLLSPRGPFGKPLLTGKYDGKAVLVGVKGEFAAFVLHRGPANRKE